MSRPLLGAAPLHDPLSSVSPPGQVSTGFADFLDGDDALNRGLECYEGGNERDAAMYFKRASEMGNPRGLFWYGRCLYEGRGVIQNTKEAMAYFQQAAELRDAFGMYGVGLCYFEGRSVIQNFDFALQYFRESARLRCDEGCLAYAKCLFEGIGVQQNSEEAALFFKKAVDLVTQQLYFGMEDAYLKVVGSKKIL